MIRKNQKTNFNIFWKILYMNIILTSFPSLPLRVFKWIERRWDVGEICVSHCCLARLDTEGTRDNLSLDWGSHPDYAVLFSIHCHAVWKQLRFFLANPLWWYQSIETSPLTFHQLPSSLIYCQSVSRLEFSNLDLSVHWRTSGSFVLWTFPPHSRNVYLFMALFSDQSKL